MRGATLYNHHLDTFLKVAEKGSFSKAAKDLYISPTAVIKQMNLLESSVGSTLFNRTHRRLSLTKAGESLRADAQHIIQYCNESIERARTAEAAGKRVVRVGSSPMTPSNFLTPYLPRVLNAMPGMTIKLVTFENTPENAARILANLGEDIDIVAGAFDEAFLKSRGCAGLLLSQEPMRIAVPPAHELYDRSIITEDDLAGQRIFIIQRGWDEATDRLNDHLRNDVENVELVEFPFLKLDEFNRCAEENALLVTIDPWEDVHPLLSSKPVEWDFRLNFGILHAPEPEPHVAKLLDAVEKLTPSGSNGQVV